jgi:hypothetical protein
MQRVSPRAFLLIAAFAGALVASLLVVFMLMGSSSAPKAQATVPTKTPTPGPSPTAKPNGAGNLSGLFDADAGPGLYHCIVRTDEDSVTLEIKLALQCYSTLSVGVGAAEPPCNASHTTGATPAPIVPGEGPCNGHSGPPPYTAQRPYKLHGFYCPVGPACPGTFGPSGPATIPGDSVYTVGCLPDIGSSLGPNAIAIIAVLNAKAQDPSAIPGTVTNSNASLYTAATNAQCATADGGQMPAGLGAPLPLPTNLTRIVTTRDSDGDSCTDMQELAQDKTGAVTKCGDDPFNPYDPTGPSPDVSGSYDIFGEAVRADVGVPGLYYNCVADIQQVVKALTARILCYIDSAGITVNPQVANCAVNPGPTCSTAGVNGCPPAAPKFCGDGLPGAAPPGCDDTAATCATLAGQGAGCPTLPCNVSQYQFADIDTKHTQLTGVYNKTTNNMELSGCFEDSDGLGQLGNVKIIAKINVHTGIGKANIWILQTPANCIDFSPAAMLAKGPGVQVEISMARQDPGDKAGGCTPNPGVGYTGCRDSDGDGCPDKRELADTAGGTGTGGGLRDPWNRWDYFNPEKPNTPHQQTVADILYVVGKYGKNQGNALYTIDADRTAIVGGNTWNLGPPDGQQTVADILAAVKQYNQNC